MEDIYNTQSELFCIIEKLYNNIKKDGADRKSSPTYVKRKLETVEAYWLEYQSNHRTLLPYEDKERPYFARREYERTEKLYLEIKSYLSRLVSEQTAETPTGSAYDQVSVASGSKSGVFQARAVTPNPSNQSEGAGGSGPGGSQQQDDFPEERSREVSHSNIITRRSTGALSKLDEMLHKQAINFKAFMRTVKGIDVNCIAEKWKFEDTLKQLQSRWSVIDSLHWEIDAILDGEDEAYEDSFSYHENIFNKLKEEINTKLWSVSHREYITPQVDIPVFTGSYHQWVSFKNLFMEAVHLNTSLSKSQKMQYLKGKIRGDAERLIQHLQISSENYTTCWDILNHRYENKKLIFSSHLSIILNLPNLQHQSLIQIKKMHDTTKESLNAIKNLGVDISTWDPILVHILTQKLDHETHADYVESLKQPRELPILQELLDYLENKFTMLEQSKRKQDIVQKDTYLNSNNYSLYPKKPLAMNVNTNNKYNYSNYHQNNRQSPKQFNKSYHATAPIIKCPLCNSDHGLFSCQKFLDQPNEIKLKTLTRLDICKNCLYSHYGKPCFSVRRCRICSGCHNTLIHDATVQRPMTSSPAGSNMRPNYRSQQNTNRVNTSHVTQQNASEILLSTAMIKVKANDGSYKIMRALIDQGSQISLITEHGAQQLGLKRQQCRGVIFGVGENESNCKGKLNITIESLYNDFSLNIEVLIMNQLIKNLPNSSLPKQHWSHINNIKLADKEFYISRPVDLLLGAEVYSSIMQEGIIRGNNQYEPLAQKTQLGWLLCGKIQSFHCNVVLTQLQDIQSFWEMEDISENSELSSEDQKCIEYYQGTTRRRSDGRYEVRIPMKESFEQDLGTSKSLAIAQFNNLEKTLIKRPELGKQYKDFINEYIDLNHMKISNNNQSKTQCYLPHHAVLRVESSTTKVRVVFNASAKTTSGKSLNDLMLRGPNLQSDLQSLILKWRQYRYAYTADIEKMYRQILVNDKDQKLQKIVWRDSSSHKLADYQLMTVTYGTKAAPFLAMITLKRLAADEKQNYPEAAKIVEESFYMDDLVHGSHDIVQGQQQITQLNQLLKSGGFTLRKWSSNETQLLKNLKEDKNSNSDFYYFKSETSSKTLGLQWKTNEDNFSFQYNINFQSTAKITKRKLLAEISKIFDPLGWIAPVVTKLKLLFQSVWRENLKWDDELPKKLQMVWLTLKEDIHNINNIKIPRWIGTSQGVTLEIHGYCDASTKAYAAVLYARIKKETTCSVVLIAAKTKLVPYNKSVSLPRLELCGAELLSKLTKKVMECFVNYEIKLYGWCDSMVVLGWLHGDQNRWKPFVANRVKNIKEVIPANYWNYIKTNDNPADAASRGLTFSQLKNQSLWWKGPSYLSEPLEINYQHINYSTNHEVKRSCNAIIKQEKYNIINHLLEKHNSFTKIILIVSWIIRALTPCRVQRPSYITLREINAANLRIVKHVQLSEFSDDINNLKKNKILSSNSKLLSLQPFLDQDGILRVGGRLRNTDLPFESKHPIIIPHSHRLTHLIIDQAHQLTYHGGVKLTLSTLRKKFWILGGINTTKKQLRNCVTCRKNKPELNPQRMGDLPESRCNPAPPFYYTGVDYTGFVDVKFNKGRGARTTKGYIAVFVCMVTKAVHLELVSELTSEAFLAALRRMAARRGTPRYIYSDNGTNFIKANRMMQEEYEQLIQIFNDSFLKEITEMKIEWRFNAPAWPTAGGLWERAVGSLKHHLKRVIGCQKLTFEEYTTLLSQLEACLNTRPLCSLTENIEDLECLTPAHFLTGRAGGNVIETAEDARTRWNLVTKIFKDIWKQWKSEYLVQLSAKSKWLKQRQNFAIGDVVIIHEENLPAGKWAMGKVVEIHPGNDGLVRVVTLKTKNGYLKRPVTKLSLLPLSNKNTNIENRDASNNTETTETLKNTNRTPVNIKKHTSKTSFMSMAISFSLFMMIISPSNAMFTLSKFNKNNKSLYFDPVADMRLIRDDWTMVTYYDMSPYWEGFKTVEKCITYLQKTCDLIPDRTRCNMILKQIQHDHTELKYYNELLLKQAFEVRDGFHSRQRRRRGLINGVGYIANSLFGILDERFVEKYTHDIRLLKENNKHIYALYKNQTSVIESEYNLLKRTEEIMNSQHKTISKHLYKLDSSIDNITLQVSRLAISEDFTLTSITAVNLISNLRRVQDTLLSTLIDIYHGRFNIHLLSPEQFRNELQIISSQLTKDLTLPLDDIATRFQEMYKLISVKSRITKDYFIFEIKFPLVSRDFFQLYKLIAIPHKIDNKMINIIPRASHIAMNLQKDAYLDTNQYELQNCLHQGTVYLCKLNRPIKHMSAVENFCKLDDLGNCQIQTTACSDEWFELTEPSTYLYFHCNSYPMRIMCDQDIKTVELDNSGIIRLENKCIAKGKDFTFYSNIPQTNTVNISQHIINNFEIAPINHFLNLTMPTAYNYSASDTNLSNDFRIVKENIEKLKHETLDESIELSGDDIHQYVVSYMGVVGAIVLAVVVWWLRRRGQRVSAGAERVPDIQLQQLSVSELSARKQSTADRQPSGSVLSERSQSMVDIATSPIITKRVYIDIEDSRV